MNNPFYSSRGYVTFFANFQMLKIKYSWSFFRLNSYINYSNIAARLLRAALKPEFRAEAARRNESHIKFTQWEGGKPASKLFSYMPLFK